MSHTKPTYFIKDKPPIIVFISEAWPGQSTRVNCKASRCLSLLFKCSGKSIINELKPRSSVIPLSFDWGFLSKHAVLATELRALQSEVLPQSTWPKTPTLKLRICCGLMDPMFLRYVLRILFLSLKPRLFRQNDMMWWSLSLMCRHF